MEILPPGSFPDFPKFSRGNFPDGKFPGFPEVLPGENFCIMSRHAFPVNFTRLNFYTKINVYRNIPHHVATYVRYNLLYYSMCYLSCYVTVVYTYTILLLFGIVLYTLLPGTLLERCTLHDIRYTYHARRTS